MPLSKPGIEDNSLSFSRGISEKLIANTELSGERLNCFSKIRKSTNMLIPTTSIPYYTGGYLDMKKQQNIYGGFIPFTVPKIKS